MVVAGSVCTATNAFRSGFCLVCLSGQIFCATSRPRIQIGISLNYSSPQRLNYGTTFGEQLLKELFGQTKQRWWLGQREGSDGNVLVNKDQNLSPTRFVEYNRNNEELSPSVSSSGDCVEQVSKPSSQPAVQCQMVLVAVSIVSC